MYDLDTLLADDSVSAIGLFTGPSGRAALIRRCAVLAAMARSQESGRAEPVQA